MSLKRRGQTWHIDIALPGGERLRRSAQTADRKAAQELHDQLKAQVWRQEHLGEKQPRSLDEAAARFLAERAHMKNIANYKNHLRFWCDRGAGMALHEFTRSWALEQLETLPAKRGEIAALNTRKNYLATASALLKAAWLEWEWMDKNYQPPSFALLRQQKPKRRGVSATPEQARALLQALPEKYQGAVAFAFMTGLRKTNVFGLTWQQVDLEHAVAWVEPEDAKAGKRITVPLNSGAIAILQKQATGRAAGEALVFPTRPPKWKVWRRIVKRAGLPEDFRFHDIRHTFASWLLMSGVDRKSVQDLGAWSTASMLDNYAHLPTHHLAQASEGVAAFLPSAQIRHTA